jgi:hypothetical protein
MSGDNAVKYTKAQRMKRWAHLNGMEKTKRMRKITKWNPIGMRSKGRPKNRQKDEVLNDLKKLKAKNWTHVVRDREACHGLVQKTEAHKGS